MNLEDIDPQSGCRLPLPRREDLDETGRRIYDSLTEPTGGTLKGLRGPGGILLHSPQLVVRARALNRYLRYEAGIEGRVRELAILITARIEIIKHRLDTDGLDPADAIVIELGREIFGARKVASETFARARAAAGCGPTVAARRSIWPPDQSRCVDGQLRCDGSAADRL